MDKAKWVAMMMHYLIKLLLSICKKYYGDLKLNQACLVKTA